MIKVISQIEKINEEKLFEDITNIIDTTQQRVIREVSRAGVILYWHIGRRINHEILSFSRAEYGTQIIKNLSDRLQKKHGIGFVR